MRFGFFENVVMFYGLCNEPVLFQNYINDILQNYLDNIYMAYFDDILIFIKNKLEYKLYIKKFLSGLYDIGLQVNITKSWFHDSEVAYLEMIVTTCDI